MASPSDLDTGAETPQDLAEALPVRLSIHDQEALDSYLERTCTANEIAPATLIRQLTTRRPPACGDHPAAAPAATCTFMMLNPDPALVEQIARATATAPGAIQRATLSRFSAGLPLQLDALDPHDRYSLRQVAMQGWFPGYGTQMCPHCLADDQLWQVAWRLPIITICLHHSAYLATECPTCRQQFRNHHHVVLRRPAWPELTCDNPRGDQSHCTQPLDRIAVHRASPEQIHTTARITAACNGTPVRILGLTWQPADYLRLLRNLTVLLLHLAAQPGIADVADWAPQVARAGADRSNARRPRWAITPPRDAWLRAAALTEADQILSADDTVAAAEQLNRWTRHTPIDANGQLAWQVDHTTATPELVGLLQAALGRRRHIIAQLRTATFTAPRPDDPLRPAESTILPANAIPQLLPLPLYEQHLRSMLGGRALTTRRYASLCLMHRRPEIRSWAQAAGRLGLETSRGRPTARAASQRLRATPARLGAAIVAIERQLPHTVDYREREEAVKNLAGMLASRRALPTALLAVGADNRPAVAIGWLWCRLAAGDPDLIPATDPITSSQTTARRYEIGRAIARFEAALTADDWTRLTALVSCQPPGA